MKKYNSYDGSLKQITTRQYLLTKNFKNSEETSTTTITEAQITKWDQEGDEVIMM